MNYHASKNHSLDKNKLMETIMCESRRVRKKILQSAKTQQNTEQRNKPTQQTTTRILLPLTTRGKETRRAYSGEFRCSYITPTEIRGLINLGTSS